MFLVSAPTFRRPKKHSGDLAVGVSVEFGASWSASLATVAVTRRVKLGYH